MTKVAAIWRKWPYRHSGANDQGAVAIGNAADCPMSSTLVASSGRADQVTEACGVRIEDA
jgi:hypothetical protein